MERFPKKTKIQQLAHTLLSLCHRLRRRHVKSTEIDIETTILKAGAFRSSPYSQAASLLMKKILGITGLTFLLRKQSIFFFFRSLGSYCSLLSLIKKDSGIGTRPTILDLANSGSDGIIQLILHIRILMPLRIKIWNRCRFICG